MKKGIHPELKPTTFVCGCGNTFTLLSTKGGTVYLEVCNQCHPFYAGKLKIKPAYYKMLAELEGGKETG
ncbi:MAG: 50S ribosomal protein L31 [Aquificae bacterium]|nr:50S ribosomal protein L31 [Aquificota bacterium]